MTPNPKVIGQDKKLIDASEMMKSLKISILPVVENNNLVGAIQSYQCDKS